MDTKRQIFNAYEEIGEVPFMKEILYPLFDQLGFKRVDFNHGPGELGKDFILEKSNEFGLPEYYAVVVKKGGIQNTSGADKNNLSEVERQIGQSFKIKIKTINGVDDLPSKVIVACSGRISKAAKTQIQDSIPANYSNANVMFLSQDELLPLVDKHLPEIFHFKLPTLGRYLTWLKNRLKDESCIDTKYSKILGKVGVTCYKASPERVEGKFKSAQDKKSVEIIQNQSTVWLQGGSGYGKTYTVFQLLEQAIEELKKSELSSLKESRIVYYFKAQELVEFLKDESFVKGLHKQLSSHFDGISEDDLIGWLKSQPSLFVIDQFEKNYDPKLIDQFIARARDIIGEPTVLILSRVLGDFNVEFSRKPTVFYVKDIKLSEAVDLLRESVPANSKKSLDCFHDLIRNGVLERIPRSALAINILSHLFSEEIENSPNNAFEFFDMFFQVALGRWREGRDANKAFDYNQVRALLENAAFEMVKGNSSSILVDELLPTAKRILDSVGETSVEPADYIRVICEGSEVCRLIGNHFEFSHRAFMEFLAGCEFFNHHWNEDFFVENITSQQWEDALIFAAGAKKRSESLLLKLPAIQAYDLQDNFFKMKNISLVTQALYHSEMLAKNGAVAGGIDAAIKIRDDKGFHEIIKKRYPKFTEMTCTLVAMGMFSSFYGRKSLVPVLMNSLTDLKSGRSRGYLISALVAVDLKDEIAYKLNLYLKTFSPQMSEPESVALEPFLKSAQDLKSFNSASVAMVLGAKKIRSLGGKAQAFIRTGYDELLNRKRSRKR
ncbi:MAG: NACHT domain-containing protein [Bacteriovoracaceae bacterium]